MKNSHIFITRLCYIVFLSIAGVSIIVVLFQLSTNKRGRRAFTRIVPPHSLNYINDITLSSERFDFIGLAENRFYLYDYQLPTNIVEINSGLSVTGTYKLILRDSINLYSPQTNVTPTRDVYIVDGQYPCFLYTTLPRTTLAKKVLKTAKFLKAFPVRKNMFIIMLYDSQLKQMIFKPANLDSGTIGNNKYVPQKVVEGIYSVDGQLLYDVDLKTFIFFYYYQNKFDCLDTNLVIKFRKNMLDSLGDTGLNVTTTNDKNTLAKHPFLINKYACISDNRLYVNSRLITKNEDNEILKKCSIIDVYSLKNGKYIQSLYAYHFRGYALCGFKVVGNIFTGIFGKYLGTFYIKRIRSETGIQASFPG